MQIDLLQYVPRKISGFDVFIEEKLIEEEEYLTIWYQQNRVKPITIKRYVDAYAIASMLGQYQAEGTKGDNKTKFEFCNKNIEEHKEFVSYLNEIGIKNEIIIGKVNFKDTFYDRSIIKRYEEETKVKVRYNTRSKQKGNYTFRTYVNSTILNTILIKALNSIRHNLAYREWEEIDNYIVHFFFSKLLTGDGSLDIRTNNREYGFPYVRVKITDQNLEYLQDYSKIMERLGFNPRIIEKYILVRSGCTLMLLLYMYDIGAFKNLSNWEKLILSIGLSLEGRRNNTYYRFVDLNKHTYFISLDIAENYNVSIRAANEWLFNKHKEGLIVRYDNTKPYRWKLSQKGVELVKLLKKFKKNYQEILSEYNESPLQILNSLKVKNKKS